MDTADETAVPRRRRPLRVARVAALLVAASAVLSVLVVVSRADDDGVRAATQRYLDLLADGDPAALAAMIEDDDLEASDIERADRLLAAATTRMSERRVIDVEVDGRPFDTLDHGYADHATARVRYRIGDSWHGGAVELGLVGGGDADRAADWRIVRPLGGTAELGYQGWAGSPLDVLVGDVLVTPAGRRELTSVGVFLHPGGYAVRPTVGEVLNAAPVSLTVGSDDVEADVLAGVTLEPTAAGMATFREQARASFAPCARNGPYCYVVSLVPDDSTDDLPDDWWQGLEGPLEVSVDGTAVTTSGTFRFRTAALTGPVAFTCTGSYLFERAQRQPTLFPGRCEAR